MSFPRYPTYKDCETSWLDKIPEHWNTTSLKRIAILKSGDSITADSITESDDYPVYGGNGIRGYTGSFTHDGHYPIVGRQGALCGNVNYAEGRFWASEHAVVISPLKDLSIRWLGETLRVMNLNQYSVSAAQPGLSVETVGNLLAPLPPKNEQLAIASFLDLETAKIDALIEEQQHLIELLQEKRQAVISHAVTKGLNPNAPMKDSGVEWLGKVPEHWITGKLCYYARLDTGSTPDRQRPEYWNGDIPWVKTGEVRYEDIHETEEKITELALQETSCSLQQPGTLLMALYGQGVTRGRVGMLMTAASCNQACAAITSSSSINERYLELYLTNAYPHVRSLGNETTQQNLNLDFVGKLELLVPPLAEQECIWQATKQRTKELDALILQSEDAIVLLQERRSALISAAVTGQIDVRGLVEVGGSEQ